MNVNEGLYSIGEASKLTHLSQQTIRYYDEMGLVVPERRDPFNNYRYYAEQQIIQLMIICRLREAKCSLKDIRNIINNKHLESIYKVLCKRNLEMEQEIKEIQRVIDSNNSLISRVNQAISLTDEKTDAYDKKYMVEEIPTMSLFCKRKKHRNYNFFRTSLDHWSALNHECKALHLKIIGAPMAIFHTELLGQFIMRDCDFTLAIQVEPDENCSMIETFGGFLAATAIHKGSYASMAETYIHLLQWINQNGYEAHEPAFEEFIISPVECIEPEMAIIKVMIPVAKVSRKTGVKVKNQWI